MSRFIHEPIIKLVIILGISLFSSIILFNAGDSLAEVTGEEKTFVGFSFKAGGAVAGFIIIFVVSFRLFDKLAQQLPPPTISRIYVKGAPKQNAGNGGKHDCKLRLFDTETGKEGLLNPKSGWENGTLTIYLVQSEMSLTDYYQVIIENELNNRWESETYDCRSPRIELNQTK